MTKSALFYSATLAVLAALAAPAAAQDAINPDGLPDLIPGRPYSPYADRAFPENAYFGDTHVHTGLSADAGGGGTILVRANRPKDAAIVLPANLSGRATAAPPFRHRSVIMLCGSTIIFGGKCVPLLFLGWAAE